MFSACRYFRAEQFARVSAADGLLAQLAADWRVAAQPQLRGHGLDPAGHARLTELELKNLAYHALIGLDGQPGACASFSRVGCAFDARLTLYLELLLPSLVNALLRVLAHEARQTPPPLAVGVLTPREIEVLRWVHDGQTNDEIAAHLGLSMLTVKNHLRNAMRKLQVRTRGQAVIRAIAAGELKAGTPKMAE
jgi:transcriptional regulator EpsA